MMPRMHDPDQCASLADKEDGLTRLVARDEARRREINADIHALDVEIARLRREKEEIENELSPVVIDPPSAERRRGGIRLRPQSRAMC